MSVDPEFARWLREGILFAAAEDAAIAGLWGGLARETEIRSTLALKPGAEAEAARQVAFLGGVLVIDTHLVSGLRLYLLGRPVAIVGNRLGYEAGPTVFVLGVEEARDTDQSTLTVLRKLA